MELSKIDWNEYCLKSKYHESEKYEFYLQVYNVGEYIPTGFLDHKELCFDCKPYHEQGYKEDRSYLRCSLIGSLYEIVKIPPKFKNKTLFDFM